MANVVHSTSRRTPLGASHHPLRGNWVEMQSLSLKRWRMWEAHKLQPSAEKEYAFFKSSINQATSGPSRKLLLLTITFNWYRFLHGKFQEVRSLPEPGERSPGWMSNWTQGLGVCFRKDCCYAGCLCHQGCQKIRLSQILTFCLKDFILPGWVGSWWRSKRTLHRTWLLEP